MFVCLCFPTTESDLKELAAKADSVDQLKSMTQAGTGCGNCQCDEALFKKVFEGQELRLPSAIESKKEKKRTS